MMEHYILVDREPTVIECFDENGRLNKAMLFKWAQWWEDPKNRIVKTTTVGPFRVSTIFLGLDHRFCGGGPPILFETMIFDGANKAWSEMFKRSFGREVENLTRRDCTWDESVKYHRKCVTRLRLLMKRAARAHAAELKTLKARREH